MKNFRNFMKLGGIRLICFILIIGFGSINALSQEMITTPVTPTGPSEWFTEVNADFQTGGAISSFGHAVEYQFDWGDGNLSAWGDPDRSYTYLTTGKFLIKARARCKTHINRISAWSLTKEIAITNHFIVPDINPPGSGTVQLSPEKPGGYGFMEQVELLAIPNDGFRFDQWTDGSTSFMNPEFVNAYKVLNVTANFVVADPLEIKSYNAIKIPDYITEPVIDGVLAEDAWDLVSSVQLLKGGYFGVWNSDWTQIGNNLVSWKAVWSSTSNCIYVAIMVEDDVKGTFDNGTTDPPPYLPFHDESIEFFIDADNSDDDYEGKFDSAQHYRVNGMNIRNLAHFPNPNDHTVYTGSDFETAVQYSGTNGNWTCEAKFEIYNTLDTDRRTLNIGDIIGFDIWYNDSDDNILFGTSYLREFISAWVYGGPSYSDAGVFGDLQLVGEPPPSIEVTSPNGGEVLKVGEPYLVSWRSTGISGNVRIQISKDGGVHYEILRWHELNDGEWEFTPDAYYVSDNCIIKIRSVDDLNVQDDSDAPFSIVPAITKPTYIANKIPDFMDSPTLDGIPDEPMWSFVPYAELKFGGDPESWGTPWTDFDNNRISWKSLWSEAENKVYVAVFVEDDVQSTFDHGDPASPDFIPWNDDCIEIFTDGNNNGGIYKDTYEEAQQWLITELGHVVLNSYPDITKYHLYTGDAISSGLVQGADGDWALEAELKIYDQYPANQRVLAENDIIGWNVWYDDSDDQSTQGGLYTRDKQLGWYYEGKAYQDADFFGNLKLNGYIPYIHVLTPDGNEDYECDCSITWESYNTSGFVHIQYYDNGLWKDIVSNTVDDGAYDWQIPVGKKLDESKIKIFDVSDMNISDQSDEYFSFDCPSGCEITILHPNVAEVIGCETEITWTSVNAGDDVRIRYFCNSVWQDVVMITPNDGSFNWQIPFNTQCQSKIKIISHENTGCWDMSDEYFTIDCIQSVQGHIHVPDVSGAEDEDLIVDISIEGNPEPIEAFGFIFKYCSSKLTVKSASKIGLTENFQFFQYNVLSPGNLNIGGFDAVPIPANSSGVIARIELHVEGCTAGETCDLSVINLVDDIESFIIHNGSFLCEASCLLGDVNMDKQITPGDALCAFQIYMNGGVPTPGTECDNKCALTCSDVNCTPDGITPGDALYIFKAYMEAKDPPLDCDPSTAILTKSRDGNGLIKIAEKTSDKPGYVSFDLNLKNMNELEAIGVDLGYPNHLLEFYNFEFRGQDSEWSTMDVRKVVDGVLRIGAYTINPITYDNLSTLVTLTFKVNESKGEGDLWLFNLANDFEGVQTFGAQFKKNAGVYDSQFTSNRYILHPNHPNPFNPETEISFNVPISSHVNITIYNTVGTKIRTLTNSQFEKGYHKIVWDGCNSEGNHMPSGVYFYRLRSGNFMQTRKMSLIR